MSSEIGPVRELLSTVSTSVGFVSSVRSHVSLQKPGTRESLVTDIALVGQVVREHVHGEGGGGDVELVADVAGLGGLWTEGFVGLFVAGQVGAGGVVLAALHAVVLELLVKN